MMKKYQDFSDQELVRLLSIGSEEAFCELYLRYKNKLVYYCVRFLKDEELAKDVVQDILSNVWENHQFIHPNSVFSSFLFTITRNRIINELRASSMHEQVILKMTESENCNKVAPADNDLLESEYFGLLQQSIEQLSPMKKKVFLMSRNEHKSHKEIAQSLNISVNTVQEYVSDSISQIKSCLSANSGIHFAVILFLMISWNMG